MKILTILNIIMTNRTKNLIETNEQNLKKSDNYIQAEIDALKEILFINLGLTYEGNDGIQFNVCLIEYLFSHLFIHFRINSFTYYRINCLGIG